MISREALRTGVLCCVELVGVMGATLVLTMLPLMLAATGSGGAVAAAVVSTGYAVGYGGFLVLGARLSDVYGHVRSLAVAATVFALAGLGLVVTSSAWTVAIARLVQGVAAAVLVPAALALITRTVPEGPRRRRAMAAWGATSAAGGAIGFLVGSTAAAIGWWRAAFLLQVVMGLGLAVLVAMLFRHHQMEPRGTTSRSLDLTGGLLVTVTLALVVAGTSLLTTRAAVAVGLLLAAAVAAGCATVAERRAPEPVLQAATLRRPRVRAGSWVAFVNTATTSSAATLLTISLQSGGRTSAALTALTMLPFSLAVILGSSGAPRLMGRHGDQRTSAVGLLGIGAGIAVLPLAGDHLLWAASGLGVAGLGIGLSAAASTHLGTSTDGDDQASAAAVLNTSAQLGTALGVAASLACAHLTGPAPVWFALAALAVVSATWAHRTPDPAA